jgi:hypothetical protein
MNVHWLSALLGIALFVSYLAIGFLFCTRAPRASRYVDEMFDADVPSRVIALTHPQAAYERTAPHPFFVLLLNPLGFALRQLLRAGGVGRVQSDRLAGGAGVALFHRLLTRAGLATSAVLLWTLLFAVSASQICFGCLPESYGFSALTLIAIFSLAAQPRPPLARLLAIGLACVGMLVTNVAAVVLVRARWLGLLTSALIAACRTRVMHEPLVILLALWLGLCAIIHAVYGACFFLRSPQWTFAVIALVAISIDRGLAERPGWRRWSLPALAVLVVLQAVNNATFVADLFHVFSRIA